MILTLIGLLTVVSVAAVGFGGFLLSTQDYFFGGVFLVFCGTGYLSIVYSFLLNTIREGKSWQS